MATPKQPTAPSAILQELLALGVIRIAADNTTLILPDNSAVTSAPTPGPSAFTTRALLAADNGATLICATSQTATVNSGLAAGFGVAVKGTISFTAGSGVTVTDVRTSGSSAPWCALTQTATDVYDIVGNKE